MGKRGICLILLFIALIPGCRHVSGAGYSPELFYGEWEAVEHVVSHEYTQNDYYPEKFLGHKMTIQENEYNMEFWSGIIEPNQDIVYSIQEMSEEEFIDYQYLNKVWFPFEMENIQLLVYSHDHAEAEAEIVGIICGEDSLLCPIGGGWYRCARVDEADQVSYRAEFENQEFVDSEGKPYDVPFVQIRGLSDKNVEEKANRVIKDTVLELAGLVGPGGLTTVYTKCQSEDFFSLVFEVNRYEETLTSTCVFSAGITIDLKSGERMKLSCFLPLNENTYKALEEYTRPNSAVYRPIAPGGAKELIELADMTETAYLEHCRRENWLAGTTMYCLSRKPSFFITEDTLFILREGDGWQTIPLSFDAIQQLSQTAAGRVIK